MYSTRGPRRPLPRSNLLRSHFELKRFFEQNFPKKPGKKLLEIGCGDSVWLPYFNLEFQYEVYGVDYSMIGCQLAQRNLDAAGATGTIECKDLFDLDEYPNGQYDTIISFGVVEHFSHPDDVIRLLGQQLRPGGLLFTHIPNFEAVASNLSKLLDRSFYDTHYEIDLKTLERFHVDNGMEIQCSTYFQALDFTLLGLTTWSPKLRSIVIRGIKVLNLGPLYLHKFIGLNPQNKLLSSFMAVLARKHDMHTSHHAHNLLENSCAG
jgi:cyclopropane fatty-acyl-phospholipid synthase-like methyltransferase